MTPVDDSSNPDALPIPPEGPDAPVRPDAPPRMVKCVKLGRELPALDEKPWPGELGDRIYAQVSAEAWQMWEERMKMILNEYRLMPWQKEAQDLVARHMEEYFFSASPTLPPGYVPPPSK